MIPDNLGNESIICWNKHQQIISILSYDKVSAISLRTLSTSSSGGYVTKIKTTILIQIFFRRLKKISDIQLGLLSSVFNRTLVLRLPFQSGTNSRQSLLISDQPQIWKGCDKMPRVFAFISDSFRKNDALPACKRKK